MKSMKVGYIHDNDERQPTTINQLGLENIKM